MYMPREESFPTPFKYIDVTRTTYTPLDAILEKQIEHYWSGWRKRIVRCVDRIHKICSTNGKATGRIYMVQGETYKETKKTSRPDDVWPNM